MRRNSKVNPVHQAYRMASALFSSFRQTCHVVGNRRQLLIRRHGIATAGRMGETAAIDNFHDHIVGGLTLVPGNRLRYFDVGAGKHPSGGAVRCGAVRCGAVRCGAVRCGAVRCAAVRGRWLLGWVTAMAGHYCYQRDR